MVEANVAASSSFLIEHFDLHEDLAADGLASLTREERAFQVRDPNGVIVQLVDWNASTSS